MNSSQVEDFRKRNLVDAIVDLSKTPAFISTSPSLRVTDRVAVAGKTLDVTGIFHGMSTGSESNKYGCGSVGDLVVYLSPQMPTLGWLTWCQWDVILFFTHQPRSIPRLARGSSALRGRASQRLPVGHGAHAVSAHTHIAPNLTPSASEPMTQATAIAPGLCGTCILLPGTCRTCCCQPLVQCRRHTAENHSPQLRQQTNEQTVHSSSSSVAGFLAAVPSFTLQVLGASDLQRGPLRLQVRAIKAHFGLHKTNTIILQLIGRPGCITPCLVQLPTFL